MKMIGMIGGLSWHSTIEYYRHINELANFRLRSDHSARCILYSVDFHKYAKLAKEDKWDIILKDFTGIAHDLMNSGAECLILCANTVHKIADALAAIIPIPFIDIADAVTNRLQTSGLLSTALLGTKFTMLDDHYLSRFEKLGIKTYLPGEGEMDRLHNMIYSELSSGIFTRNSREWLSGLIMEMNGQGAASITLACTELPVLLRGEEFPLPILDTTFLHSEAAMNFALKDD